MQKIGILTFHRAFNYGAFLQCYSLKRYLEGNGYSVDVIDYWPNGHASAYNYFNTEFFKRQSLIRKIRYLLTFLVSFRRKFVRFEKIKRLQTRYFNLDRNVKFVFGEQLKSLKYDYILYGSDQIWWKSRLENYIGFDTVYWGQYVDSSIKKVSYAASMGIIDLTDADKTCIDDWLSSFHKISVRENELRNHLREFTNHNIDLVCDPVFLTRKSDWEECLSSIKLPLRYVLLFNLMHSAEARVVADKVAKDLNCEVVEISSMVLPWRFGKDLIQTADPFEFLYAIANAEFVISSSFHGTAFSVIFEKQFYSIGMQNNSGRVASLLSILGIPERMISQAAQVNTEDKIDYCIVKSPLQNYIKTSEDFLCAI